MKRTFGLWIIALLILSTAALATPTWTGDAADGLSATATATVATSFTGTHSAPDNGAATVTLIGAPSFVSVSTDQSTATFTVTSASAQGPYNFFANVSDSNSSNLTPVTLTVGPAPLMTLVSPSAQQVGSDNGRASNPQADEAEDRIFRTSTTFVISNNGTAPITGLTATPTIQTGFTSNEVNMTVKNVPTTLNAGATATVTVELNVPGSLDAVNANNKLREEAFKVADIVFTGTSSSQSVTSTTAINVQRENQLEVRKVIVCVNDKCKSVDDGDDVKSIKPGDKMSIEIVVENKYSENDREDLDIEDVEVEFDIDDDDFSEDDSEDLDDIGADDEESETFTFDVEDDVKDGTYDLIVKASGTDENGALHGQEIEIDLEVEREKHEIELRGVSLSPSSLSCGKDTARLSVSFANIGRSDEDEVAIEATIDELGITERLGLFDLDEDDTRSESLSLIMPENAEKKEYTVVVKSFYDTSVQSDEEVVTLTLAECDGSSASSATSTSTQATTPTPTVGTGSTTTATAQTPVVQRRAPIASTQQGSSTDTEESFTDSPWYVALLALLAVVLVAVLIVLAVKVLGRSSNEL